jgi:hypothetical protein
LQADRALPAIGETSAQSAELVAPPADLGSAVTDPAATLRSAIGRLTRAFATATDETIAGIVAERANMRAELASLERIAAGVVDLASRRK